jgi:hypothetical protein
MLSCANNSEENTTSAQNHKTPKVELADRSILPTIQHEHPRDTIELDAPKENSKNCDKPRHFNIVMKFVETNGTTIPYEEWRRSNKDSTGLQVTLDTRTIQLYFYEDDQLIVVIEDNKSIYMPDYTVSNENNQLEISAWASLVEGEIQIQQRADHWCDLISDLKRKK